MEDVPEAQVDAAFLIMSRIATTEQFSFGRTYWLSACLSAEICISAGSIL